MPLPLARRSPIAPVSLRAGMPPGRFLVDPELDGASYRKQGQHDCPDDHGAERHRTAEPDPLEFTPRGSMRLEEIEATLGPEGD